MRHASGRNWRHFVSHAFDEDRLAVAKSALLDSLGRASLVGLTLPDIGSGSGLHSLAAHHAGADRVVSFDYEPNSVEGSMSLHRLTGSPASWSVELGDVLDRAFLASLPPADVVESWGVLHRTGKVWEAIENAASLIGPDGVALLALYASDVYADPAAWLEVKRRYDLASLLGRRLIEARHLWVDLVRPGLRRPHRAWATVSGYRRQRACPTRHLRRDR